MFFKKSIIFTFLFVLTGLKVMGQIQSAISSIDATCSGNGTATVSPTGGVPPYQFEWREGYSGPVFSTSASVSGLEPALYSVKITDANNDFIVDTTSVSPTIIGYAYTSSPANCPLANGVAIAVAYDGLAPYSYTWSTGATTNSISGLAGNSVSIVSARDANGCDVYFTDFNAAYYVKQESVKMGMQSSLTVTDVTTIPVDCDNTNGSATALVSGGLSPYSYEWASGATTQTISNISSGYQIVKVTDANGCETKGYGNVYFDNSCTASISGKIFQDDNGNCIQDAGEYPILNEYIYVFGEGSLLIRNDRMVQANSNGEYSCLYGIPDEYLVKVANYYNDVYRSVECPSTESYTITIPASGVDYPNNDFAMKPSSFVEDVSLIGKSDWSIPRPGFEYGYYINYKNIGTLHSDGYIEVVYSSIDEFVSSTPAADYHDPFARILRFNYSTLLFGQIRTIRLNYSLSTTATLGATFSHQIKAEIGATDPTASNNLETYFFTVVGSYDPNDISVTPDGFINDEQMELTYSIRFQNTGTYLAELVLIKDVIDQNLEIGTISDIVASHPFIVRERDGRLVEFAFENINLPDSNSNERESHGFVNFKIRRKANIAPGTYIHNKVDIFFDYNDPITTNMTTNIIAHPTSTVSKGVFVNGNVFPNPAKSYVGFSFEKDIVNIQLLTGSGVLVMEQEVGHKKNFEVDLNQERGMYFYKAFSVDGLMYSGKLLIE